MKFNYFNYDLVKYIIPTYKLNLKDKRKVILIADLHDYTKNKDKSNILGENIKKENPHHIVIAGDILQGFQWENNRSINSLSYFLDNISENVPVFMSQGNHDLKGNNKNNVNIRNYNFMKLSKIRPGMVFPLINDKVTYDGFEIIGYTPSYRLVNGVSNQKHGLAHDEFIKEYNANGIFVDDSNNIVEFVGHNPSLVGQSKSNIGLGKLENVDTFFTGHYHNGYLLNKTIEKNPDKYLDFGYTENIFDLDQNGKLLINSINPLILKKINLCRGVIYINELCRQEILCLSNNHFYANISDKINEQQWVPISNLEATERIMTNSLKGLVITGGIKKFSSFSNILGDIPEITEVIYSGEDIKSKSRLKTIR